MRITKIEKWKVVVPIKPDVGISPEYESHVGWDVIEATFWQIPKYIIRINTDDSSVVGLGETSRGCFEQQIDKSIADLEGKEIESIDLHNLPIEHDSAYSAFELAVFDAMGKSLGMSVARLLGKQVRDRVHVDYWAHRRTPAELARKVKEAKELGFDSIKIKIKLGDPNVERLQAIADAVGMNFKVTLDANRRFFLPCHTVSFIDALGPLRQIVAVFEDPVPHETDWYVLLRQKLQVPIAQHLGDGKSVLNAVKHEAVDMLNISPYSMVEFSKQCYIAEIAGVPVWHGSGMDLGILDASYIQVCAATPAVTLPCDIVGNLLREDDLIVEPIEYQNGYAILPKKPGLGVELDETALKKYTVA